MKLKKYSRVLAWGMIAFLVMSSPVGATENAINEDAGYEEQNQSEGNDTISIGDSDVNNENALPEESDVVNEENDTKSSEKSDEMNATQPMMGEDGNEISTMSLTSEYKLRYRVHSQTYGWMDWVSGDSIAGTVGRSKRLEAIQIQVVDKNGNPTDKIHVEYRVHAQTYGWMDWVADGQTAGTEGKSKRLEAIQIRVRDNEGTQYPISYRTHVQTYGWMDTITSDGVAGTVGKSKRMEAIIISLSDTIQKPVDSGNDSSVENQSTTITYSGHVQTYGNVKAVKNGEVLGTVGQSKRIEGIKIDLSQPSTNTLSGSIVYSAHIQTYGWSQEVTHGTYCGTTGQSKRLEAVKINLTGELAQQYDIYYRTHVQTYGWLGWAKNGESAGTEGYSKRMEAVQIQLVKKGDAAPDTTQTAFVKKQTTNNDNSDVGNGSNNSKPSGDTVVTPTNDVVKKIRTYTTVPYVYGGSTPAGWDCSGCVQWICKNILNVSVSRTSYTQVKDGTAISISEPDKWKVGDILCFGGTNSVEHTALYIGDGMMIHAVNTQFGTMVQNVKEYQAWETGLRLVAVRRVL